jgi:hypothetical protein
MKVDTVIDWPRVIDDIALLLGETVEGTGLRTRASTVAVAVHLNVPRSTLLRWVDGSKVEYHEGVRLLAIWAALTSKAVNFAPRTRRILSAADFRE